jgi:hypothetical protein
VQRCHIRAAGLFGQTLDFCDREHLARFLWEFGSDWLWLTRNECVYFVSVKPDKMAVLADIHVNFRSGGKATPIIGCRHDGQGTLTRPSPRIACSHSGLIGSGVNRLRSNSIVTARPPQRSQP